LRCQAVEETVNAEGTSITFTTPAGAAAGPVDVVVTTDGGTATTTFTYVDENPPAGEPTVTSVTPRTAIAKVGGISLVRGTNLAETTEVTVGGREADFIVLSDRQLVVFLPGLRQGSYDLVVSNEAGDSDPVRIKYVRLGGFGWGGIFGWGHRW